jgi:hypothetical protein
MSERVKKVLGASKKMASFNDKMENCLINPLFSNVFTKHLFSENFVQKSLLFFGQNTFFEKIYNCLPIF